MKSPAQKLGGYMQGLKVIVMHHKVIVEALRQVRHLKYLQDEDADHLHQLTINAHHEAEDLICKDRENGYRFLTHTFNEAQRELEYVRPKIQHELENLRGQGLDEYDSHFSNVKHIALELEDFIGGLADLLIYYYPKEALENQVTVKECASIPAKQRLNREKDSQEASKQNLSNQKPEDTQNLKLTTFQNLFLELYDGEKGISPEVYRPTNLEEYAKRCNTKPETVKEKMNRLRNCYEAYLNNRNNVRGIEDESEKQRLRKFQKDLQEIVRITTDQTKLAGIEQFIDEIEKITKGQ
jgi:hypothetical protein